MRKQFFSFYLCLMMAFHAFGENASEPQCTQKLFDQYKSYKIDGSRHIPENELPQGEWRKACVITRASAMTAEDDKDFKQDRVFNEDLEDMTVFDLCCKHKNTYNAFRFVMPKVINQDFKCTPPEQPSSSPTKEFKGVECSCHKNCTLPSIEEETKKLFN